MNPKREANILSLIKEWIALIAAIIALITTIAGWFLTSSKLARQKEQIAQLESCLGVVANIGKPKNGEHLPPKFDVRGTSTIHETCRYVFIIIRDRSRPSWKISDLVQINTNGQWAGQAKLDHIPVGGEAEITARVTADPTAYSIDHYFSYPPMKGVSSNIVRVRRVQ